MQIRHRLSDDTPTDFIDGALIQPSDFVDALNRIDAAFGVTEETFGLNVMSGSQHPNPQYAHNDDRHKRRNEKDDPEEGYAPKPFVVEQQRNAKCYDNGDRHAERNHI